MKIFWQKGFSLIELLVALAILAVIIAVAVPSMSSMIEANRTDSTAQALFTSMVAARSEAVARNQNVVLCKSPNGIFCSTANDWEQGWLTYVDENGDGVKDITDPITGSFSSLHNDFTLRTGAAYSNKLEFRPDGSVSQVGTFRLCGPDANTADAKSIVLNITGRPRGTEGAAQCP